MNVSIKESDLENEKTTEKNEDPEEMRMKWDDTEELGSIYAKISEGYGQGNFDSFFENFNLLVDLSQDYYFSPTEEFESLSIAKIIINIISDKEIDDFIRSQALKLVVNLTKSKIDNFIMIFIGNGILPVLNSVLEGSEDDELNEKALAALTNISYNSEESRELVYGNIGVNVIATFIKSIPIESTLIGLATRLLYSLSKSYQESDIPIVIDVVSYLLNSPNISSHIWGMWIIALICNNEEIAQNIREIPNLSEVLESFIDSEVVEMKEPAVNLILQIHTYSEGFIEGFAYEKLIDVLKDEESSLDERVATIFANLMTNPEQTSFFINNGYILFFVDAYHTGSYGARIMILKCLYNAMQTMPMSCIQQFIDDGVIEVLADALQFSSTESHVHTLSCLLTLMKIEGAKEQFLEHVDESSFEEIEEDDNETVQMLYSQLEEIISS